MGKGRIVSHIGDGLYNVELLHNRDRIEAELQFLSARITELDEQLAALQEERDTLAAERDAIVAQIDAALASAAEGESPNVSALLAQLAQASANVQAQDVRVGMVQGRLLEATKRQEQLQAIPEDPVQQAWCSDITEDLTGEVATVEVPAEGVVGEFATWRRVQIRPGYEGRASYLPARDGQMFHREGQVGYQAYFNAAILPGVQRHKPQYRIGTITAVDHEEHTCSLTIQGEDSSAQALIIDPPDLQYEKIGVPIEYMECDSAVFEEGDRVLVEFVDRDWSQPKVIGFEKEPKRCYIVMAYTMGIQMTHDAYIDPNPDGYPELPDTIVDEETDKRIGLFRDRGVSRVDARLFGGDGLVFLYAGDFDEVLSATKISELPPFAAWATFDLPQIGKGGFDVPTVTFTRNLPTPPGWADTVDVPVMGTKQVTDPVTGATGLYPLNKPMDSFTLSDEQVVVQWRQYRATDFKFYDTGTQAQVYYSGSVSGTLAGEQTVTLDIEDFPEFIAYNGATYQRQVFVNYVPFDFDNDRGQDDEWWLDRICIRYDVYVPPE